MAVIREAAGTWRELAGVRPDAFPNLVRSLNSLSLRLADLGREDALAAIQEAVIILRERAAAHPDAFRPHMEQSRILIDWLLNSDSDETPGA